ncbi:ankyrin repeat domain-containing protein [Luteimonas sp. MC1750]|uniref:ankyrin repeat domain-containing protein n=1 Tax=Luteimonas sp. MC1750 TaxID=2799326 RepID=UPI0018F07B3E|nr:ankyrin repeat domain-containing protein [Luteimonas sp. MC1750]MBJ6983995.1 ankyrin repeat domain-containing protein [Luteimonas sp. MC1750]QQO06807.1 ankyrin repeat domain-containing protein [Luteimonas sp. MC1750]
MGGKADSLTLAAKNLRAELKHVGITASVKTSRFAGGNSIDVKVLDQEKVDQVGKLAHKYRVDDYSYTPWTKTFGGSRFTGADLAQGEDREKLLGTYKAPPKKEMPLAEKHLRFMTGIQRGTVSTVSRYVEDFKGDDEKMGRAWWAATQNVNKSGSGQGVLGVLVQKGGFDPNEPTGVTDTSALHLVVRTPDVAKILLDAGADPNAVAGMGRTPLHFAAQRGNSQTVEYLLQAGANPNARDHQGHTALIECMLDMRRTGADNDRIVSSLLDAGADPNIQQKEGRTALFLASSPEIAQALVAAGGDPTIKDNSGQRADNCPSVPHEVKAVYRQELLAKVAKASRNADAADLATPEDALATRQAKYGRAM